MPGGLGGNILALGYCRSTCNKVQLLARFKVNLGMKRGKEVYFESTNTSGNGLKGFRKFAQRNHNRTSFISPLMMTGLQI